MAIHAFPGTHEREAGTGDIKGIRIAGPQDIPFLLDLMEVAYKDMGLSRDHVAEYLMLIAQSPNYLVMRGDKAAAVCALYSLPHLPGEFLASLIHAGSMEGSGWELYQIVQLMVDWAKSHKATEFILEGGIGQDLGPIAKRLGAEPIPLSYSVKL